MMKSLGHIDILITIFNQEEIIERVLYGVFSNTTTPFNLVLIFDGCSDRTKPRALHYLKRWKSSLLRDLIIKDTPNLFELRANNFGFKLCQSEFLITIQDDMVVQEYGWEKRLTYPLRKFDDVFAVSGRSTQNIMEIGNGRREKYVDQAAFEMKTLKRNIFAVRDIGIRGPLALRTSYLKELNYLNDAYAPGALDDAEISLRAWRDKKWKIGAFGVKYLSKQEWSKVNAPDSTMKAWESWGRNQDRLYSDFKEYIDSGVKHNEDILIDERDIDYTRGFVSFVHKIWGFMKYPLRFDKRRIKTVYRKTFRRSIETIKKPIVKLLELVLGKNFGKIASEQGFKKAAERFLSQLP